MATADIDAADAEIRRRTMELVTLKIHRNALAAINRRLPPEILSHVFILLRDNLWEDTTWLSWILVTHVCHHWRQLACSTALLWTHIRIQRKVHMDCVDWMLSRSQQVSLTIDIFVPYSKPLPEFRATVICTLNRMDRIKSLRFWAAEEESSGDQIFRLLLRRASQACLESLFVWGQYQLWIPTLKNVQRLFSPTMRNLCVRLTDIARIHDICSALSGMPSLEKLELHAASITGTFDEISWENPPQEKLQLNSLRRIFLDGPPRLCAIVLEYAEFSNQASIIVRCPELVAMESYGDEGFAMLLRALSSKLCGVGSTENPQQISSLYVRNFTSEAFTVGVSVAVDGWYTHYSPDTLRTKPDGAKFHIVLPRQGALDFVTNIRQCLQDVRSVYVRMHTFQEQWGDVIRGMTTLRELIVRGQVCTVLPRILGADERWNTSMSKHQLQGHLRSRPILPHLQTLAIEEPTIGSVADNHWLSLFKRVLTARTQLSIGPTAISIASFSRGAVEDAFVKSGIVSRPGCVVKFTQSYYDDHEMSEFEWEIFYEELFYEHEDDDEEELSDSEGLYSDSDAGIWASGSDEDVGFAAEDSVDEDDDEATDTDSEDGWGLD